MPTALTALPPPRPKRPRTAAQQEASRRNGRRSRGPVSAEGKRWSRRNALRHGLCATVTLLARNGTTLDLLAALLWRQDHGTALEMRAMAELMDAVAVGALRLRATPAQDRAADRLLHDLLRFARYNSATRQALCHVRRSPAPTGSRPGIETRAPGSSRPRIMAVQHAYRVRSATRYFTAGICWVMQWMPPPPWRRSTTSSWTTRRLGKAWLKMR